MMQISKRIKRIHQKRERAKKLASDGLFDESDDEIIDAYMNACDLVHSYGPTYFLDEEYEFLESVIKEFDNER
jgi:hypothetical protein